MEEDPKDSLFTNQDGRTMNHKNKRGPSDIDRELESLLESHRTIIKVIGTGGAGNNTITRLMEAGIEGVMTFAINTDAQDLLFAQAHQKVLIGRDVTSGLGSGSDPKVGEESAMESEKELRELASNTDLVFVTCGLGGGTGTGSAPILAEIAREVGALTISIVTLPFSEEGVMRWNNAQYGLERLRKNSDTLIVIENDRLLELDPNLSLDQAFQVADEILVNAVTGITELVTQKGLVNLDFADIRTIMKDGGTALIGMAESDSPERSVEAVEKAIENPLIDLKIDGARSALLNIVGGKDMTIKDAKTAMHTLARKLDSSARIIWGARINPELENKVNVMILATGLKDGDIDRLPRSQNVDSAAFSKEVSTTASSETANIPVPENEEVSQADDLQPEPDQAESADEQSGRKETKQIFCEIMEEESDADLKIFSDSLQVLQENTTDREQWEELRRASSSLAGTAQMFDFDDISTLMNSTEDLLATIINKDFYFEPVLELFLDLPQHLRSMIQKEPDSVKWAKEFETRANMVVAALGGGEIDSKEGFLERLEQIDRNMEEHLGEAGESEDQSLASDLEAEEDPQQKADSSDSEQISSANEATDYVDNPLGGGEEAPQ